MALPVGLQLHSLRDACKEDFFKTIGDVAKIGYSGVEFAGFFGKSAKEVRKVVADAGLSILGAHVGLDLLLPEQFDATVAYHKELGNATLVVPGLAESYRNSADACRKTAALLQGIADQLKTHGMRTGYHLHGFDTKPLDDHGRPNSIYDLVIGNTGFDFIMQVDVGNAVEAGACPVKMIERYPGRARQIHLKEGRPGKWNLPFGAGRVPWREVFRAAAAVGGTECYIVEVEQYWDDPLECARQDRAILKCMGV